MTTNNNPDPLVEQLARQFHEAYERLAPSFSYETRLESRTAWEDVPEQNRRLMVATVREVVTPILDALEQKDAEIARLKSENRGV